MNRVAVDNAWPRRLRAVAKARGVTGVDLAHRVGCSYGAVRGYLDGLRAPATVAVARLAEVLDVEPLVIAPRSEAERVVSDKVLDQLAQAGPDLELLDRLASVGGEGRLWSCLAVLTGRVRGDLMAAHAQAGEVLDEIEAASVRS